jgi:hypothetical protein
MAAMRRAHGRPRAGRRGYGSPLPAPRRARPAAPASAARGVVELGQTVDRADADLDVRVPGLEPGQPRQQPQRRERRAGAHVHLPRNRLEAAQAVERQRSGLADPRWRWRGPGAGPGRPALAGPRRGRAAGILAGRRAGGSAQAAAAPGRWRGRAAGAGGLGRAGHLGRSGAGPGLGRHGLAGGRPQRRGQGPPGPGRHAGG